MTYDDFMAALCVWREARGETYQAKLAVAAVILNRTKDSARRWSKTLHKVVLQKYQFSSFNVGDPNATRFPAQGTSQDWFEFEDCQKAVAEAQAGNDPTNGANHYFDISIDFPAWADSDKHTISIGRLKFYKL
jgi:spore germination cell wall hydrolase CwlJ-like protein